MSIRRVHRVFLAALAIFASGRARADMFYGLTKDGDFITIDSTSGAGALVGNTGYSDLRGLDVAPDGTVFAAGAGVLITIDPITGASTLVGTTGGLIEAIAFLGGELYGTVDDFGASGAADTLVRIDTSTGQLTRVGTFGASYLDMNGLASSPDGVLLGANATIGNPGLGSLVMIDDTTGTAALIGHYNGILTGLDFSPSGILYGTTIPDIVAGGVSALVLIDPSSGSLTTVGQIGFDTVTSLAFAPPAVPEPATLLSLGMGGVLVAATRVRRRGRCAA